MMPRFVPTALALLAALPACLSAQEASAKEDERLNALVRDDLQWREPRNHITVGIRMLSAGGKINFGNLGERLVDPVPGISAGVVARTYDDGAVGVDQLRANEKDANGNQVPLTNGRYLIYSTVTQNVVDADGKVTGTEQVTKLTGNYLGYQEGLTRNWTAENQTQYDAHPGYVGMSTYSAISEGGGFSEEQGATGGLELEFSRDMGRIGRRVQWGFAAGVTLNGLNSKTAGTVNATLRTYTDYYKISGTSQPNLPYSAPFTTVLFDEAGNVLNENGLEITVPISALPDAALSTQTDVAGGASVTGRWQVKGAYFMVKLGPTLRTQITERFGLIASAGFAGAYAGTRYTAFESYKVGTGASELELKVDLPDGSTATKFMAGYYADLTLDWAANDRTGLFGGVTAQQLGDYTQRLGGRTARIDLGSTVGLRGGVSVKF
jgi:hypothetical protein